MNTYHYAGHLSSSSRIIGQRRNPFRYVFRDNEWIAEVGFGVHGQHFIIDAVDLATVLNLPNSKISETALSVSEKLTLPLYSLTDHLVPTWDYDNGGVACHRWPGTGQKISLSSKLFNLKPGVRTRKPNTDPLDYRRKNFKAPPTEAVEKEWPLEVNSLSILETGDPTKATVVEAYPGLKDPTVNPYWLVELNGQQFYRMKCLTGEIFYFDLEDLPKIQRVMGPETPLTTWYKNKTGAREKEGYMVCRTRAQDGDKHLKLHHVILGETWTQRADLNMTVDHRNWNKWDNRKINLCLADAKTQLTNRARLRSKNSAAKRIRT